MSKASINRLVRYYSSTIKGYLIPRVACALVILFIIFFLNIPLSVYGQDQVEVVKSFKDLNGLEVTDVYPGDEFYVDVMVRGYSRCDPTQQVPFDAVILIDRSPSMAGKLDEAKNAAKHFVQLASQASTNLTTGAIRIAVITFADEADVVISLSSNYEEISEAIDNISRTWFAGTNMKEGIQEAQDILYSSPNAQKIILLLTDGCPTPQVEQEIYIRNNLLPLAMDAGIRYETVGVGLNPCAGLLSDLSHFTGGEYAHVIDESDIVGAFGDFFRDAVSCAVANRILLTEKIDTSVVEVVPGFAQGSQGMTMPSPGDLQDFAVNGQINVKYGALRSGETRTFTFKLRTKACLSPLSSHDTVEIIPNLTTDITYGFGQADGSISATQRSLVCHKPPHLCVTKNYSASDRQIIIGLKSMYPPAAGEENTLKDIQVYEYPSRQYQYRHTDTPDPPKRVIPGKLVDLLYWNIPSLTPGETKEIRFGVDFIGSSPPDLNPMFLDSPGPKRIGIQVREGCHCGEISLGYIKYVAPGNAHEKIHLPQVRWNEFVIETVQFGRPDLFITPAYDQMEFRNGIHEVLDSTFLEQNAGLLPGNWPNAHWSNQWPGRSSKDIWVDSSSNGYVTAFEPRNAQNVINDIHAHLSHVRWDPLTGWFFGVLGQGDLFYASQPNRIYVHIRNTGLGISPAITQGIVLQAKNSTTGRYETINTVDLRSVASGDKTFVGVEVEQEAVTSEFLSRIRRRPFGYWDNVGLAELRILLKETSKEKHTTNNVATEVILVVK